MTLFLLLPVSFLFFKLPLLFSHFLLPSPSLTFFFPSSFSLAILSHFSLSPPSSLTPISHSLLPFSHSPLFLSPFPPGQPEGAEMAAAEGERENWDVVGEYTNKTLRLKADRWTKIVQHEDTRSTLLDFLDSSAEQVGRFLVPVGGAWLSLSSLGVL